MEGTHLSVILLSAVSKESQFISSEEVYLQSRIGHMMIEEAVQVQQSLQTSTYISFFQRIGLVIAQRLVESRKESPSYAQRSIPFTHGDTEGRTQRRQLMLHQRRFPDACREIFLHPHRKFVKQVILSVGISRDTFRIHRLGQAVRQTCHQLKAEVVLLPRVSHVNLVGKQVHPRFDETVHKTVHPVIPLQSPVNAECRLPVFRSIEARAISSETCHRTDYPRAVSFISHQVIRQAKQVRKFHTSLLDSVIDSPSHRQSVRVECRNILGDSDTKLLGCRERNGFSRQISHTSED